MLAMTTTKISDLNNDFILLYSFKNFEIAGKQAT
jgi:hypothetical protein